MIRSKILKMFFSLLQGCGSPKDAANMSNSTFRPNVLKTFQNTRVSMPHWWISNRKMPFLSLVLIFGSCSNDAEIASHALGQKGEQLGIAQVSDPNVGHVAARGENSSDIVKRLLKRGKQLNESNNYMEALDNFNKALEIEPDNTDAMLGRWSSLRKTRNKRNYLDIVKEATDLIAVDSKNKKAYLERAAANTLLQRFQDAIDDCNEVIKIDKSYAEAYYFRAMAHVGIPNAKSNDFSTAFDDINRAIRIEKKSKFYLWRATLNRRLNKPDEASRDAKLAFEISRGDFQVLSMLGKMYMDTKEYGKAMAVFRNLVDHHPNSTAAKSNVALAHIASGELHLALKLLDRLVGKEFQNLELRWLRANCRMEDKQWEGAIIDLCAIELAKNATVQEKEKAQRIIFGLMLSRRVNYSRQTELRSQYKLELQQWELKSLNTAVDSAPRAIEPLMSRAEKLKEDKKYAAAVEDYKRVLELNPKFARAHAGLVLLYFELAEYSKSIKHAERLLKLDPAGWEECEYWVCLCLCKMKEHEKALARLDLAVKEYPSSSIFFLMRGQVKIAMGNQNVVEDFQKSFELGNQSAKLKLQQYKLAIKHRHIDQLRAAFINLSAEAWSRLGEAQKDAAIRCKQGPHVGFGKAPNPSNLKQDRKMLFKFAIDNFSSALKVDKTLNESRYYRGFCFAKLELHRDAEKDFEYLANVDPSAFHYWQLAISQHNQERFSDAIKTYEKSLKLANGYKYVEQIRSQYRESKRQASLAKSQQRLNPAMDRWIQKEEANWEFRQWLKRQR